ncbi:hypothetical protein HDU93_005931 [Gonapodya sp. JEL0774]|nr:hypothetical protein HDU93_005931 [Gonapodya sp. JEL0774]
MDYTKKHSRTSAEDDYRVRLLSPSPERGFETANEQSEVASQLHETATDPSTSSLLDKVVDVITSWTKVHGPETVEMAKEWMYHLDVELEDIRVFKDLEQETGIPKAYIATYMAVVVFLSFYFNM